LNETEVALRTLADAKPYQPNALSGCAGKRNPDVVAGANDFVNCFTIGLAGESANENRLRVVFIGQIGELTGSPSLKRRVRESFGTQESAVADRQYCFNGEAFAGVSAEVVKLC
jgi:hypothetical protein